METPTLHSLSLTGVISETRRIIRANYDHFSNLSFLFLPLAVTVLITPARRLSGQLSTADHHHKSPILHLLYLLTVLYILTLSAIGTITFSTHNAFQGKPINFSTSIKTLATSFFPILSTSIVIHLLQLCISLTFLAFVASIVAAPQNLGLGFVTIDYESSAELTSWFHAVIAETLLAILVYFQVNWSLAYPIVVAESKWGFALLRRSWYLVKGMRSVPLSLLLHFGGFGFLMLYGNEILII